MKLFLTILAVLYAVSPYDLLPDRIHPVLGWLDDLVVLWLLWRAFYAVKNRGAGGPFQQRAEDRTSAGGASGGASNGDRADEKKRAAAKDPYTVLGVSPGASPGEIKSAYRGLAAKYHPDKLTHLGEEFRELAEQRFKEIQEAYQKLGGR